VSEFEQSLNDDNPKLIPQPLIPVTIVNLDNIVDLSVVAPYIHDSPPKEKY